MGNGYTFRGFGIHGYRSFGGTAMQYVAPIGKIMLLAGQNNAGKSNALNALFQLGSKPSKDRAEEFAEDFRFRSDGWTPDTALSISFAFETTDLLNHYKNDLRIDPAFVGFFEQILSDQEVTRGFDGLTWFDFALTFTRSGVAVNAVPASFIAAANSQRPSGHAGAAFLAVARAKGDNTSRTSTENAAELFITLQSVWDHVPKVERLEASRRITSDGVASALEAQLRNGRNLIWGLAELRSPNDSMRATAEPRWQAITEFVRSVLEDPTAEILIDSERTEISVRTNGRAMALRNLGSGMEQILIIAATATVHSGVIIAVEEPEIYLHPSLQRRLIEYLATTSNQYLISTHSAHILNAELASIAHVTNSDGWTSIQRSSAPGEIATIAADLGYRASDIVQANYVVWVEGPSDRTYVRHWIRLVDTRLIEGAHFTIMFYGGALLNHLAADDPEVQEFIALNRLGRTFAIIMDRDKAVGTQPNETKLRVLAELEAASNWGWVTEGYTIENYVNPERLASVFHEEYPTRPFNVPKSANVSPFRESVVAGKKFKPSKVVIAKRVVEMAGSDTEWWRLDALSQAKELASRIAAANGLGDGTAH